MSSDNQDSDQFVSAGVQYGDPTMLWVASKRIQTLIETRPSLPPLARIDIFPENSKLKLRF